MKVCEALNRVLYVRGKDRETKGRKQKNGKYSTFHMTGGGEGVRRKSFRMIVAKSAIERKGEAETGVSDKAEHHCGCRRQSLEPGEGLRGDEGGSRENK